MKKANFRLMAAIFTTIIFTAMIYPAAAETKLIPREVLFGNPVKSSLQISPNGEYYSFLAPSKDKKVMNVWVQKRGSKDATMMTQDTHRGISGYGWTFNNNLVYLQDKGGDENFHLYSVNMENKVIRDLTPFQGIKANNFIFDKKFPNEMLVGLNLRNRRAFDMYRVNLKTGAIVLDTKNPGIILGWSTDHDFKIRVASAMNPATGGTIIKVRDDVKKPWRDLLQAPFGENIAFRGFSSKGDTIYVTTSIGGDTTRLVEVDFKSGKELRTIISDPKSDVGAVNMDRDTHKITRVSFNYLKPKYVFYDKKLEKEYLYLKKQHPGVVGLGSQDLKKEYRIVYYTNDNAPVKYYLFNKKTKDLKYLFTNRPQLEQYKLAVMKPMIIKSRDKLKLVSYLTLPVGKKPKNLPFVLLVHGGPWARDYWGYDPISQMLANRGYAVLKVNFRGSTGFGKKFLNAGDNEWGVGKMQHDLTDAVKWAIKKGIANPKKICIMGGSYGGYATLAGLVFTPKLYCCGVDIVGPSNIRTLFKSIPPYWAPMKKMLIKRVGDVEKDEVVNKRISPLFHVDKIKSPLLIGQGKNDPRVNIKESDQMVEAMRKKKLPVKYVVYPDEGHGFRRTENSLDFWGHVDGFLAKHLKGRFEPYKKIKGSSAEVR